jgi:hypothetical protein
MIQTASLEITREMLVLVAEIDEFKGAWQVLGTLAPERPSALRRVATIEGHWLVDPDRGESAVGPRGRAPAVQPGDHVLRLARQAASGRLGRGHGDGLRILVGHPAGLETHQGLHRDLLRYSDKNERHRGGYKTAANSVAAFDTDGTQVGIVFETASPFDTPARMAELVSWYEGAMRLGALHPLLAIGLFAAVFLEVGPLPGRQRPLVQTGLKPCRFAARRRPSRRDGSAEPHHGSLRLRLGAPRSPTRRTRPLRTPPSRRAHGRPNARR